MIELLIPVVVALVGWWIVHFLNAKRDLDNNRREIRLAYLVQAYRDLGEGAARSPASVEKRKLESAFHDVQLFGSPKQQKILSQIISRHEAEGYAEVDPLLAILRDELRDELQLPASQKPFSFYRIKNASSESSVG